MVRITLLAALLVASQAFGATIQGEQCADGTRKVAGYCAADLTALLATSVQSGGATCNYNIDRADGTTEVCVAPAATTLTTHAEVAACNGSGEVGGSADSVSAAGNRGVAVTSLANGSPLRCWFSHVNPSTWESNVVSSLEFTPPTPGVGGDNADRLDALLGEYTIPFTVNYPADPVITSESTATNNSELSAAIQVAGRKVTVTGDARGSLPNPANDIWIELADGAQIGNAGGVWDFGFGGVQRMRISSQNPRQGEYHGGLTFPTDTTDVLIDGVTFVETSSSGTARHNIYDSQRIAIINSWVTGNNFTLLANSGNNADVILANSYFLARNVPAGGNGAIRLKDINRLVIVDVYADTTDTGYEPLRLEDDVHNAFVRNVIGEGGGLRVSRMVGSSNPTDIDIADTDFYHTSFLAISHNDGSASDVIRLTMTDCTFHTDSATPGSNVISSPQGSWSITNVRYAAYESPPAWSFK